MVVLAAIVVVGAGLITYTTWPSGPSQGPSSSPAASGPGRQTATQTTAQSDQPNVQEPEPSVAGEPQTQTSSSTMIPSPEQPATQLFADTQPMTPWWSTTSKERPRLDLSTPETAVRSFTKAIASGDAASVMACFLPGGTDFEDMQEILNADPDDPEQRGEYEMKLWLQSLDPDAEMPIIETTEDRGAMKMTWQVTFIKDVTAHGQTFRAGDTFNLDATLRRSGDSWLIDNF